MSNQQLPEKRAQNKFEKIKNKFIMKAFLVLALLVNLAALHATAQQQQFQCQNEGFFVNPSDCSKFVRCVDTWQTGRFQVYHFDCPDGKIGGFE